MGHVKRSHIPELGPICKPRKKIAATSSESEGDGETDYLTEQFHNEKWLDDDTCKWLSSGSSLPSSCFKGYRLSSFFEPTLEEFLVSLISRTKISRNFLSKQVSLFDGSRFGPIEEASLVLEKMQINDEPMLQEELKEDEVVAWLIASTRNDLSDYSATFSESSESLCSETFEDSSTCDDSSSRVSKGLDSPHWARNIGKTVCSVSLINLDAEESDWISEKQTELDLIQSDFPSPSYKSSWWGGSEIMSLGSLVCLSNEESVAKSENGAVSEAFDMVDSSPDKPLFWPTDENSDWSSDVTWDFFLSPRKINNKFVSPEGSSYGSFRVGVQGKKMDMEKGCRRRLGFGSGSKSPNILEFQWTGNKKEVGRSSTMPSRLGESTKNSANTSHHNVEVKAVEENGNGLMMEPNVWLGEEYDEVPIETLLGLDEFNGHEGVESEFNEDAFYLNELQDSQFCLDM